MKHSRGILVLSVVLATGVVVAGIWFLNRGAQGDAPVDVLRVPAVDDAAARGAGPPADVLPREPTALEPALGAPPSDAAGAEAAAAAAPSRTLRGRVVMADGSALPEELRVHARLARPEPRIESLRDKVRDSSDDGHDDEASALLPDLRALTSDSPDAVAAALHEHAARPRLPSESDVREQTLTLVAPDGSFEMARAPARPVWLTVDDTLLYVDPAVRVPVGEDFAELHLLRGASVSGRITDSDGAGVPDTDVALGTKFDPFMVFDSSARMVSVKVETDAEGRYVARQLPAGLPLLLTASAERGSLQVAQTEVKALAAGEQRSVDLLLPPGIVVAGRVRKADGSPVPQARVHLNRLDVVLGDIGSTAMAGVGRSSDQTDEHGAFRFDSVSEGQWEVVLGEAGYRPVHSERMSLATGHDVTDIVLLAEEGLVIAGRVLTRDGQPVKDAWVQGALPVSMMDMQANLDRQFRGRVRTDATGAFRVAGFDPGTIQLRVNAEGYVNTRQEVQAGDEQVVVTLRPLASLSGIVVSLIDGEPVTEFRASVLPSGGLFDFTDMEGMEDRMSNLRSSRSFRDREEGTFTLEELWPGEYDLSVSSSGFGTTVLKSVEVPEEGRRGVVVLLPPECVLTGTIVSARDGLPVKGAVVATGRRGLMEAMTEGLVGTQPEAQTDERGVFTLGGLTGTRAFSLTVRHEAFRDLSVPDLLLAPGEARDLGRLLLSSGAAVHGRVLDSSRKPAPGITVLVSDSMGTTMRRATSDAEGRYRVEGLGAGTYNVMRMDFTMNMGADDPAGFMKDLAFQAVTLAENEEKEVDLGPKAEGGTRLSGRVSATGGPVPGALLTVVPMQGGFSSMGFASSDKEGNFAFENVAPGEYALAVTVMEGNGAAAAGQASSPVSERITIGGLPEQRHDVLLPGGELHGTVESAVDGSRLAGVRVVLERVDEGRPDFGLSSAMNGRVGETYCDAAGAFRFRFLPSGAYAVVAGGQNVVGMGAKGWALARLTDLNVTSGGPGFAVRVKLRPAGGIEGVIRGIGGQPLPGVAVWVGTGNGHWLSTFSEVASDAAGAYSVGALQEGSWTLAFGGGSHALKLVSGLLVQEGQTTALDVVLKPGVAVQLQTAGHSSNALQIVLSGPDGVVPTGLAAMNEVMAQTSLDGTLHLGSFAPGAYHLTVMSGGDSLLDSSFSLAAGASTKVLALEP